MRIVISGTVGVGKTTAATNLTERLKGMEKDVDFVLELPEKNVYLDLYYKNRPEWSFLIQMDFLLQRYRTLLEEKEKHDVSPNKIVIFDRHFLDDFIFANLNSIREDMSSFQFAQYKNTNFEMAAKIWPEDQPDYFIMLKAPFEMIMERVRERGRASELEVDEAYWRDLYDQYYNNEEIREYLEENVKNYIEIDISNLEQEDVVDSILSKIGL